MSYHSFSINAPWSRASMKGERGTLPQEHSAYYGDRQSCSPTPPGSARARDSFDGGSRHFILASSGTTASPRVQSRFPALQPDTPQSLVSELRTELQQLRSMKGSRDNSAMLALPNTWAAGRAGMSPGLSAPSRKALDAAASALAGAEARALDVMHKAAASHAMDPKLMREAVDTLRGIAAHRTEAMQAMLQQQAAAARLPGIEGIGREGDVDEDRPAWAFGMDDTEYDGEWVARQLEEQREEEQARAIEAIRAEIKEASILLRKQLQIREQTDEQREMDVLRGQAEALLTAVRFRHVPPKRRPVAEREVPQAGLDLLEKRLAAGLDDRQAAERQSAQVEENQAQPAPRAKEEGQRPAHPPTPPPQQQAPEPQKQHTAPRPQQQEPAPAPAPPKPPAAVPPEQREPARAPPPAPAAPVTQAPEPDESESEWEEVEEEAEPPPPHVLTAEQMAQVGQAVQQQMQQVQAAGQMPPELQEIQAKMTQIEAQAAQMTPEQQQEAMAVYQQLQAQYQQTGLQWQEHLTEQMGQHMFPPPPPPPPKMKRVKKQKQKKPAALGKAAPQPSAAKPRPAASAAPRPDKTAAKPKPAQQTGSKTKSPAPRTSSTPRATTGPKPKKVADEPPAPEPALGWTKAASESAAARVPEETLDEAPVPVQPAAPAQCAELDKLAAFLGGSYTTGQSWHLMLLELVRDHPVSMVCALMDEPGLPLRWVNRAFERLTLWTNEECVGRNCRFLQGKKTEKPAVRVMVKSLREGVPMQPIVLTNYKKDGAEFANVLSLHPVHDSNGRYIYSLGVLIPAEALQTEENQVAVELRRALPTTFEASLHTEVPRVEASVEEGAANALQWLVPMTAFSRRLLLLDAEATLDCLIDHSLSTANPVAIDMLKAYIAQEVDTGSRKSGYVQILETAVEFARFKLGKGTKPAEKLARQFYERMFGETVKDPLMLGKMFKKQAETARTALCDSLVHDFIKDKSYCKPLVKALLGEGSGQHTVDRDAWASAARDLIWAEYSIPADVSGFLFSFVSIAETFPTCIVISDMCLAGNPMIFVNREFCRITGYSKEDATGLNCRFLQGPKTEPASVATIQDTLRRGVDCFVRITNYRKNGESFENLLSMRPVHDSNGVYRFCIGVQFDATVSPQNRMGKLKKLLPLLPNELPVNAPPVGVRHIKQFKAGENTDAADVEAVSEAVDAALAKRGAMASVQKSKAEGANAEYAENFDEMKRRLMRQKKPKERK
jgi:PAS domain S-box-containing protein